MGSEEATIVCMLPGWLGGGGHERSKETLPHNYVSLYLWLTGRTMARPELTEASQNSGRASKTQRTKRGAGTR